MKTPVCNIIEAEHEDGFQEYVYEDGTRVPHGEPVGVELEENGEVRFIMLEGVFFSSEPHK